jgi:hypothetical protein
MSNTTDYTKDKNKDKSTPDTTTDTGVEGKTKSGSGGKKWTLDDDDHKCACTNCCCHSRVRRSGNVCGRCVENCNKYLKISGGFKQSSGLG